MLLIARKLTADSIAIAIRSSIILKKNTFINFKVLRFPEVLCLSVSGSIENGKTDFDETWYTLLVTKISIVNYSGLAKLVEWFR